MNDDDNQKALGTLILIGIALFAGPALLTRLGSGIAAWSLEHRILLTREQSAVVIPGLEVGLDVHRVLILTLTVLAVASIAALIRRTRKQTP